MGTRTKNTVKVVFLWKWTEAQEIPDLTFLWERLFVTDLEGSER
jgi:hypothetical protein